METKTKTPVVADKKTTICIHCHRYESYLWTDHLAVETRWVPPPGYEPLLVQFQCRDCGKYTYERKPTMNEQNQVYTIFQCHRCSHQWPSKQKSPIICPRCKSPYWNRPKTKKQTTHIVTHHAPGRGKEGH
jgi:hypothetical protein